MKTLFERLFAGLQYILPQHFLSRLVYALMRCEVNWLKNLIIRLINKLAGIKTEEALSTELGNYAHFNAWFTRELHSEARFFDQHPCAFLSPSDGKISATGSIDIDRIFQAKGKDYSLHDLLAGDPVCSKFVDGYFSTIYLSPRDYHRVHMPLTGYLKRMIHIPGRLFSVAPFTVRQVPRIFARNERIVCIFDTEYGPLVMVLVGAMLVSSMETVWAGEITPTKSRKIKVTDYPDKDIKLVKGEEMGRFNMGSTVILLMPEGSVIPETELTAGSAVKVGQRLGQVNDKRI